MWLVTTLVAAIVATCLYFRYPSKEYRLDILSVMFWGATIMILVDHILGYTGGAFLEMETDGLISNGILLGLVMMIPVFVIWGCILILKKITGKVTG